MLVKRVNKAEPEFEPVTVKVTFENLDELRQMWHLLNPSWKTLREHFFDKPSYCNPRIPFPKEDCFSDSKLWKVIDNLVREAAHADVNQ